MSLAVASQLTSLDYTFPIYDDSMEAIPHVSKDILLAQTLRLPKFNIPSPPNMAEQPMNKMFNINSRSQLKSPLESILSDNRTLIKSYMEKLNPRQLPKTATSALRVSKRQTTPVTNKTIFFSPSGKAKRSASSTPNSFKDVHPSLKKKSSINLKQKLLKMDQASLISIAKPFAPNNDIAIHNDTYHEEDSDYDHLACHADNIMRMAVDSTMLGSTFNSSFSSSFSNSFSVESGKDFFDKEAKKSILEGLNF